MYLVAGVSGKTGAAAATALLEKKEPVRVLVRSEDKGRSWREKGAEVAVASLDDVSGLARALQGVKGAYLLVPPDLTSTDYLARGRRFLGAMTEALGSARVPHVVFLSSIGAQLAKGTGPVVILHEGESRLAGLRATRVTFVRASYFMENIGSLASVARSQGVLPCLFDPNRRIAMIATEDIGRTAARALLEPPAHKEIIELEALQESSYADAARILARHLGRPVEAVRVPDEGVVPTLVQSGFSDQMAGLFKEMAHALDTGTMRFGGGDARHVRGPTTLESVLAKLAPG
jgi:uncharacterized protein YbjT (DUF2867 family)